MIVVDTQAWVWWVTGHERLSRPARAALDVAEAVGVCSISIMELANTVRRGRLTLDRELPVWIRQATQRQRVAVLQLSSEVALRAGALEWGHGDPADRIVVATALQTQSPVVTSDRHIREFKGVQSIW